MNYLAHFHLSYGDDDLLIGALLGDFIKGPLKGERSQSIEQGILLHRKIDAFTDSHPIMREAQQLFDPRFRRYAGIMTDVLFDHFLNRYWPHYHPQPLNHFSREIFDVIVDNPALTPAALVQANNLARYDVFVNYQHWQTVDAALSRISERLIRDNPLADAANELEKNYQALETLFAEFYPQLQQHTDSIRNDFQSDSAK